MRRRVYGKEKEQLEANNALRAQRASGIAASVVKRRQHKSDDEFLAKLVHTLHGVALGVEGRDMEALAGRPEVEEALDHIRRIKAAFPKVTS